MTSTVTGYFGSGWCEQCRKYSLLFKSLADAYPSIVFQVEAIDTTFEHSHSVFPQCVFVKDGKTLKRMEGFDVEEMKKGIRLLL
jgi:hypothetical protein